ncbi:MAG TPA: phage tail protein [Prolixibacteraceae bacterium]|nr:phage tail protein [Prolixibacteraceae bacterium]
MADYYPPLAFHFRVEFTNIKGEFEFQSVSGLTAERETEQVAEGGENRFKHQLPGRTRYSNIILKRGLKVNSGLVKWCREALLDFNIVPTDLTIILLNEEHEPLQTWNVVHAWPVKWEVSDFNAEENRISVETIELTYNYFNIQ